MRTTLSAAILLSSTVAITSASCGLAASAEGDQKDAQTPVVQSNRMITKPITNVKPFTPPPKGTPMITPGKGFVFKFPKAENDNEPVVVDPAADVEKARGLHAQAMELFKQQKVEEATAKEKEAVAAAPHFWLPSAGLAYILFQQKKPFDALQASQIAVYGKHGAVADRNAGRLFEWIHWFEPAILEFKKAIKEEPDNWVNYTGLADCYIIQGQYPEAAQVLDRMPVSALSQFDPLNETAIRYMEIGEYQRAQDDFVKALTLADDASKQHVKDLLFSCAVQTDDKKVLAEYTPQISDELKNGKPDLILQSRVDLAQKPSEGDDILKDAAAFQGNQADQLFYVIGLKLAKRADAASGADQTEWLKRSIIAFQNASSRNNTNLKYQLAVASVAERLGDRDTVTKVLAAIKESVPPGSDALDLDNIPPKEMRSKLEDFQKSNLVHAFPIAKPGTTNDAQPAIYESTARELKLRLTKPSCSCHARSIAMEMGRTPGVMYTSYTHEAKPALAIVYDAKKTSQKKLMESRLMASLKEPVDQEGDIAIPRLTDLSNVVFSMDRMQMMPSSHPTKPTLELPVDTTGEIAETKPAPAVH